MNTVTDTCPDHDLVAATERLYALERAKDLDGWGSLWADEARVTFPLSAEPGKYDLIGKDSLVAMCRQKFVDRARVEIELRTERLVCGRRVLVHLTATIHLAAGPVVTLPILVVLTFDERGLITLMEEYVNEVHLTGLVK